MVAENKTRAKPAKLPHALAILLKRCDRTLADANRPRAMAEITTPRAMNRDTQSRLATTLSSYENRVYRSRLSGSIMTDSRVEMAVMVTDRARSALNREHHQLEYEPPGLDVTTRRVTPLAWPILRVLTTMNPNAGRTRNCNVMPVNMATLFLTCLAIDRVSTVADIPKTRKKRSMEPRMSTHGIAIAYYVVEIRLEPKTRTIVLRSAVGLQSEANGRDTTHTKTRPVARQIRNRRSLRPRKQGRRSLDSISWRLLCCHLFWNQRERERERERREEETR
mmetsp:Transcript_28534/g.62110  ORF Transcript_28534/g.62110 Transcript_28534/m.62110 type:complete len:279 (-) Transcript_28534:70-906(-)